MPQVKLISPITRQEIRKIRVAAYCRVSSNSADQQNSYANQIRVYTSLIQRKKEWELVEIFADEGLSGMNAQNRTEFQRMIKMCEQHQIDLIVTKSVSRFARNAKESLEYVRKLKLLGVGVQFEKEGIYTLALGDEMLLNTFSAIAQEESRRKERMPILQPLESMERISRQALADDLDTVLERISREDIGLVITEEGKDDLVLCPASWFNLDYVDDFSCVINSALRYAMRSEDEESAAVVQYLRRHYQLFDEKTLSVAVADLERELNQPIVTLKQPQVWKELQELFRQRLDELRKESSEGEETHHG